MMAHRFVLLVGPFLLWLLLLQLHWPCGFLAFVMFQFVLRPSPSQFPFDRLMSQYSGDHPIGLGGSATIKG
uniref:Putative secreted protein n=1 Tax=Anopheles darlingi TaxID=43151 RepID=A0A2M4DIN9_ANODA